MVPHTPTSWSIDAHDLETNYPSLVLGVVVLVFTSSTIIICIICCSVAHAFTHRHIYHMHRHATIKKPSTDREIGSLTTVDCLVFAKTKGSRLCTTITVPKGSSQENNPSFNPNDTCGDGTKATVVDLTSIARNSRLLYALPEENDNSCAEDLSPVSQMEDDVFVLLDQQVQRPFQSQNLSDTSNDYSNTDQLDLSKQQTTDSKTEHHHPPWQRYTPYPPQQIGNMFNVFPANTSSGNTHGNTNACCIHSNGVQSNNRPASLDWKFVKQQSSQSTKNWSSASDTLGLLSTEQTEKPKLPMRICLAEVGIARLFPFCDSDKAKMVVIAKQAIVSKHEECGTISHFINQ